MSVFLIGYRGSGKTSVGKHVARKLRWDFTDSDSIIANATELTIKDIFEQHGEEHFRMLETKTIEGLCTWDDCVIALGGGAVMREENRKFIRGSGFPIVYLHADAETLHERIAGDPKTQATRPSLTHLGGSVDEVRAVLNKRLPVYREIATHEVDVANRSIKQVADQILEWIGARKR
jgi:shikimate kinase